MPYSKEKCCFGSAINGKPPSYETIQENVLKQAASTRITALTTTCGKIYRKPRIGELIDTFITINQKNKRYHSSL